MSFEMFCEQILSNVVAVSPKSKLLQTANLERDKILRHHFHEKILVADPPRTGGIRSELFPLYLKSQVARCKGGGDFLTELS